MESERVCYVKGAEEEKTARATVSISIESLNHLPSLEPLVTASLLEPLFQVDAVPRSRKLRIMNLLSIRRLRKLGKRGWDCHEFSILFQRRTSFEPNREHTG